MKISWVVIVCSAIAGTLALSSPSLAAVKTAKECRQEWQANKAANEAKKITEKDYVAKCRAEAAAETPKAKPAAATAPKEKAKDVKAEKTSAPAKKTAKACQEEWRANKAANQAKGITEKAYVASCQAGTTAATPAATPAAAPAAPVAAPKEKPAAAPAAAPAVAPKEKTAAPMAPAPAARPAPATGTPAGVNQYAAEAQAKARCGSGTVVWANLDSKIYHYAGYNDYGHTKTGAYMCEKDATDQGMRAAKNEKHP